MSHHPRRILTPGASRKRKEREAFYSYNPPAQAVANSPSKATVGSLPISSNRLLAGYMAHEFLTKGTLFGQRFDPARAEAMPVAGSSSSESKITKPEAAEVGGKKVYASYAEVANIVKAEGTHVPGIVNPTQLARWIQM